MKKQKTLSLESTKDVGATDICAQVDWDRFLSYVQVALCSAGYQPIAKMSEHEALPDRRKHLLEITEGRKIVSLQRFAKLAGYRGINSSGFHRRLTELVKARKLDVQQSGFRGHILHHGKLVKIREDTVW